MSSQMQMFSSGRLAIWARDVDVASPKKFRIVLKCDFHFQIVVQILVPSSPSSHLVKKTCYHDQDSYALQSRGGRIDSGHDRGLNLKRGGHLDNPYREESSIHIFACDMMSFISTRATGW
jgi:hypothetical protein